MTHECGWCDLQFPHCDQRVLHAPGECQYCDCHPEWQALRLTWGINFTGHYDLDRALCPAEQVRGLGNVGQETGWAGNAPTLGRFPDEDELIEAVESLKSIERDLHKPT